MPRRLLCRLLAVGGTSALLLASSTDAASAMEEQPEPVIEVEFGGLDGTVLAGTVRCDPGLHVDVSATVSQSTKQGPDGRIVVDVSGGGETDGLRCGSQPTPFSVDLGGDGVLVPGEISYQIWATASDDQGGPAGSAGGDLLLEQEINLRIGSGPISITISPVAGVSPDGPVAEGTITCDEPMAMTLRVGGRQAWTELMNEAEVACDGTTNFAVPIWSLPAQALPGPANVSIEVWRSGAGVGQPSLRSIAFQDVELRNATREPDFRPDRGEYEAADVGAVRRVDGRLEVGVKLPTVPCQPAYGYSVEIVAYPLQVVIDGRWYAPRLFSRREYAGTPCNGTFRTVVQFDDTVGDGAVAIEFYIRAPGYGPAVPGWSSYNAVTTTPK